uniref:Uncharacterized protein n=1 Tax=Arundo donax TaxID=35708 RepID=A0A0A9FMI0_ARUDO
MSLKSKEKNSNYRSFLLLNSTITYY